MDVSLAPKEIELEVEDLDFVQVAFRKVEKKDLLGGISVVNLPEKMEKNYTTYSLDGMEAYVGGFNGNLWSMGSDYLLLIDGVPREATNVLASEIEQITFLKGASAVALYGSRAAKGVIYISTKRGKANTKEINVRANTGYFTHRYKKRQSTIRQFYCFVCYTYRFAFYHSFGQGLARCKMKICKYNLIFFYQFILFLQRFLHLYHHICFGIYVLYCRNNSSARPMLRQEKYADPLPLPVRYI